MTTPRKHAELAARYMADDTLKCWIRCNGSNRWSPCIDTPEWSNDCEYYVGHEPPAPEIVVKGWRLPAPMKEAPPMKTRYWFDDVIGVHSDIWCNCTVDIYRLKTGHCFRTDMEALAWHSFNMKLRMESVK